MTELLQYIAELLEQIRALLSRQRAGSATAAPNAPDTQDVRIINQPVQVRLASATVQAEIQQTLDVNVANTPLAVSQSGSWTVGISGQPVRTRPDDVLYAAVSASSAGDTTVVPAVSGKRIRVVAFALVAAGTVTVKFRSGSTDITGGMRLVEAGGVAHAFDGGLFQTAVGQALVINLSAGQPVGGYVVYREV